MQVQMRAAWRWFLWPLIFLLVLGFWGTGALAGQEPVKVVLNDEPLVSEVTPFIEDGRTFVPVRALLEALGAEVKWDGTTGTVEVVKGDTTIRLTVGSRVATVVREGVTQVHHLDVAPKIIQGRTFIPARFVATALGGEVSWDPSSRVVKIIFQIGPQKEELVIAVTRDYGGPTYPGNAWCETNIYEPLIFLNGKLEPEPGLATAWERVDPVTWRIHLRTGVTFHNGKAFDAHAVKYSFQYAVGEKGNAYLKTRLAEVVDPEMIVVENAQTLLIKTKKPFPFLPYLLSHPYLAMVEPSAAQRGEVVGTGPFKFAEHLKDQYIKVVRNDNYWGEKPKFRQVTFKVIPDPSTRVMALQKGEVDLAVEIPRENAEILKDDFQVVYAPWAGSFALLFNRAKEPLNDPSVRRAICMGVNKTDIVKRLFGKSGDVAKGLVPRGLLFSAEDTLRPPEFNLAEGRRLLESIGYRDDDGDGLLEKGGKKLTLKLNIWGDKYKDMAQVIASDLKKMGIDAQLTTMEKGTYYEDFTAGNWDMCIDSRGLYWGAPSTLIFDTFYSKSGLKGPFHQGVSSEVDRLIEEAMELEEEKHFKTASEKYTEVQKICLEKEAIICPIVFPKVVIACREDISQLEFHPLFPFNNGATVKALVKMQAGR